MMNFPQWIYPISFSLLTAGVLPVASAQEAASRLQNTAIDSPECTYYKEALVDVVRGLVEPAKSLLVAAHDRGCEAAASYLTVVYKAGLDGFPVSQESYLEWGKAAAQRDPLVAIDVATELQSKGDLYAARAVLISNEQASGEVLALLSDLDSKLGFKEESLRHSYGAFRSGNKDAAKPLVERALSMGQAGDAYLIEVVETMPIQSGPDALFRYCEIMEIEGSGVSLLKRFSAAVLARGLGDPRAEKIILDTQKRISSEGISLLEKISIDQAYAQHVLSEGR